MNKEEQQIHDKIEAIDEVLDTLSDIIIDSFLFTRNQPAKSDIVNMNSDSLRCEDDRIGQHRKVLSSPVRSFLL